MATNTISQPPATPCPPEQNIGPTQENTGPEDDCEFLPLTHARAFLIAASTIKDSLNPARALEDVHKNRPSPDQSDPPHSPHPSCRGCPTDHPIRHDFS